MLAFSTRSCPTLAPSGSLHVSFHSEESPTRLHAPLPTRLMLKGNGIVSPEQSPVSSISGCSDDCMSYPMTSSRRTAGRNSYAEFRATHSRVVRFFNLPPLDPNTVFKSTFSCALNHERPIPAPVSLWVRDGDDGVYAVFADHEQADAALSLSGSSFSVATALEQELEPLSNLRRLDLQSASDMLTTTTSDTPLRPDMYAPRTASTSIAGLTSALDSMRLNPEVGAMSSSTHPSASSTPFAEYTLSSNPPNPKSSFRLGDWICASPTCAAHNFGRNISCIGCGHPRPNLTNSTAALNSASLGGPAMRPNPSPRFVAQPQIHPPTPLQLANAMHAQQPPYGAAVGRVPMPPAPRSPLIANKPPAPSYPLLTPSGRALAIGGKVQNVSSNPLSPCVMYWPDNEPFPEQGQIRPPASAGIQHPPIMNTGNRGPIEHQPGDWICQKCNYLNWRRRKVCQTCFPYAEGNGDSISAAVQAERIQLLANVLNQETNLGSVPLRSPAMTPNPLAQLPLRSHSVTPPVAHHRLHTGAYPAPHRSRSHYDLGAQYAAANPIYQTSGARHSVPSSPLSTVFTRPSTPAVLEPPVGTLLPSFLQDIVHSPSLSPSSTTSAELSVEDYEDELANAIYTTQAQVQHRVYAGDRSRNMSRSSSSSLRAHPLGNIWTFDGEESKVLTRTSPTNDHAAPNNRHCIA
ncbi:hypothetical protein PUNSTDRAFT_145765 [Punctularia strigosozonata HHB-11173 SS5]|uniref:uncharacterized protein n=1 Tax=Punctularia strigosozonata (strain HHB-11173) TaxID=741275 RepID=UPI0004417E8E|nr:uncharacterized protein PUNSTDRAFT_145765 [Punctularia strigosozonata HHB-11173 SS5]EIN05864.1 hypothetical protein PUNSTDRAFT_145765 [Punctularia strigosozonata HHB-11173 SS5]